MHRCVWWTGSAAVAISLCLLSAGAVGTSRMVQFAQNVSDVSRKLQDETGVPFIHGLPETVRALQSLVRYAAALRRGVEWPQ